MGIVRVSGPQLDRFAQAILGRIPVPRYAQYSEFFDDDGSLIDQGIAILFKQPHSFTGEDVFELHGHGGPAVMQMLLERCLNLGARLAEPGEFSQRAFLNGKLDLTQAEGIADLINASSAQAARSAMRSLHGDFSRAIHHLVDGLVELRIFTEATLDFPEEDIDTADRKWQQNRLTILQAEIEQILTQAQQGSILREGANIALIGQPNVGKSSLLNALAGEEVALVSEIAGTTRDTIQQAITIKGVPLHIVDTAGLRETIDIVEQMGVDRAKQTAKKADLILLLQEAGQDNAQSNEELLQHIPEGVPRICVINKIDMVAQSPKIVETPNETQVWVSAKTGDGLDLLRNKILQMVGWHAEGGIYMARQRHLEALYRAKRHLSKADVQDLGAELLAEELREAQEALNSITGEFTADDLLGDIFRKFCIGK